MASSVVVANPGRALRLASLLVNKRVLTLQLSYSVLTWGRNTEGQCGIELTAIVNRPSLVDTLSGVSVRSVAAGAAHSAVTTAKGCVYTWGCGRAGKLGQGHAHDLCTPTRVESLVGRGDIVQIALGHHHSLFVDAAGSVWSCGENKEGQCGHGTSLDTIARQRRQEVLHNAGFGYAADRLSRTNGGGHAQLQEARGPHSGDENTDTAVSLSLANPFLHKFIELSTRHAEHDMVRQLIAASHAGSSQQMTMRAVQAASYGLSAELGFESHLGPPGMLPGQLHTPARLGRDLNPIMGSSEALQSAQYAGTALGLGVERVAEVAAGKYFSGAVTSDGDIWTFGGGFNGELGNDSSWSTAAARVQGDVARLVASHGGAAKLAAGHTFCVCLTRSGKVIAWGKLGGMKASRSVMVVDGLPNTIAYIAAGAQHALFSDGVRVWMAGRTLLRGDVHDASWSHPDEVLRCESEGIASVSAGGFASAATTCDGSLYMWGTLLERTRVEQLHAASSPSSESPHAQPSQPSADGAYVDWQWPGFGAASPQRVPGLQGVVQCALGTNHALVLTE